MTNTMLGMSKPGIDGLDHEAHGAWLNSGVSLK